jgi:hypothetical protein
VLQEFADGVTELLQLHPFERFLPLTIGSSFGTLTRCVVDGHLQLVRV